MYSKKEWQVNDYEPTPYPLWHDNEEEGECLQKVNPSNDHNKNTGRTETMRQNLFSTVIWVAGLLLSDY